MKIPKSKSKAGLALIIMMVAMANQICGQRSTNNTTGILSKCVSSPEGLPYSENLLYINNNKTLGNVNAYDFRTETDQWSPNQQEFQFRVNVNSKEEQQAYRSILSARSGVYSAKQMKYVSEVLEETYSHLVGCIFSAQKSDLLDQKMNISLDRKSVALKLFSTNDKVDPSAILSTEQDILEIQLDMLENEADLNSHEKAINIQTKNDLSSEDLITVDAISALLLNGLNDSISAPDLMQAQSQKDQEFAKLSLEKAEGNKWLDFLQLRYQADDRVGFQSEIAIGAAFIIPSRGNNKAKTTEAALDYIESAYDYDIELTKYKSEMEALKLKLSATIAYYNKINELIKNQNLQQTYNEYLDISDMSPLTLLDIKNKILRQDRMLLSAKESVYKVYIECISKSGRIIEMPLRNYLSPNLDELK